MGAELWTGFKLGDRWVRPEVNKIDDTRIDAKAMEVLVALAEVSPAVVSGSALLDRVWPNVVVVDNVVYQAIAQLRKMLGDEARSPRYIECIPRRGYRLIAQVIGDTVGPGLPTEKRHNLPEELTSFIGRDRELSELVVLLKQRRMLTLTGVGGCGKTRLALAVARACVPSFPDGVWVVDLAPLSHESQVIHAVAKSLQIRESQGQSLHESVLASLISARSLLVLDNCEHVVASCAQLAEALLGQTNQLRILATSREGLGIGAEQPWAVQPLATPTCEDVASIERLGAVASVRLFVERAKVLQRRFDLNAETAPAVAEICRRLDGLPFAIELAAARIRDMSPEQVEVRLRDRFQLLSGGSRTALPRHRTLQATLDWSHQLLREPEQTLLRRLAVFAGDFSVDAAMALAKANDEREQTLDVLTRLVDQSMLQVDPTTGRYRMLETVRQYANDRLVESDEAALVRDRHRDYFVALADGLYRDFEAGSWQSDAFRRCLSEQNNLNAALAWCELNHTHELSERQETLRMVSWVVHALVDQDLLLQKARRETYNDEAYNDYVTAHRLRDQFYTGGADFSATQQAVEYVDRALVLDPDFASALDLRAQLYIWRVGGEQWDVAAREARKFIDRALAKDTKRASTLNQLAAVQIAFELDLGAAERTLESLQTIDPKYRYLHELHALLAMHRGRVGDAMQYWQRQLEVDPYSAVPHWYVALLAVIQGDFELADRQIDTVVRLSPRDPLRGLLMRMQILMRRGEIEQAKAAFEPLWVQLKPFSPTAFGFYLARLGHEAEARALVDRISRDPSVEPGLVFATYYGLKEYDQALEWLIPTIDNRDQFALSTVRMSNAYPELQDLPGYRDVLAHLDSIQRSP